MSDDLLLDRFSRIKDSYWYDYGASADAARIKYGYNRASSRTWREDVVATSQSKDFDELYAHDGLHRLKDMERGRLNGGHTALTTTTFGQCWTLDETGNWDKFQQDDNGNGTWDLKQDRTANKANEITDITETAGPSWVTPGYDAAGNMTTVPKPVDPTVSFTATYDAWNRLVKLVDGSNTVQENEYDARNYRTVRKDYSGGTLSETRHFYYTENWQSIEERVGTSTNAERQHVWGRRYVDDVVLRDRDTDANGTLDERLYGMQDANWNVIALCDVDGDVQERYAYAAYGTPAFLSPTYGSRSDSSYDWETLYCGYRWETATELFAVRNRALNSQLGTWLRRDPLGRFSGANLYEYVDGQPLGSVDPRGLEVPGYNHNYPLYLGGSQTQPTMWMEQANHTAFHDYFRDLFQNAGVQTVGDRGFGKPARDHWDTLSRTQQHDHIKDAMRAGGISDADINKHWDDIIEGATPGIHNKDRNHRGARIGGHRPRGKPPGRLRRALGTIGTGAKRLCIALGIIDGARAFAEGASGEGHHEGATGVLPGAGNVAHNAVMGPEVEWAFQEGMEAAGSGLRMERLPENDCRRLGSGSGVDMSDLEY